jgi:O-antigen/teichoic acid export membrane protein
MNPRALSGQVASTFITNVALAALGMLTGVLAARLLGVQGRGELAAIQSWAMFISSFATLGVFDAIIYLGARDKERDGSIALSATLLSVTAGTAFFACGWIAMPLLLKAQSAAVIQVSRWYLLFVFGNALSGLPIFLIRARQEVFKWNLLRLSSPLVWLAVLGFCYARDIRLSTTVAEIQLGASLGLTLLMSLYGVKIIGLSARPSLKYWAGLLRFGLPVFLSTLPQFLTLRVDQLLMAAFLPADILGVYVVAVAWAGATDMVSAAIGAVLFPAVAALGHSSEQHRLIVKSLRLGLAASLASSLVMGLLAVPLVPTLFGKGFSGAIPISWVLLFAGVFASYNNLAEQGLKGLGRTKAVLWAELLGLVVTIGALALLLMPLKAMGAALASLIAYISVSTCLTILYAQITGVGTPRFITGLVLMGRFGDRTVNQ